MDQPDKNIRENSETAFRRFMSSQYSSAAFLSLIVVNILHNSCVFSDATTVLNLASGRVTHLVDLISLTIRLAACGVLVTVWVLKHSGQMASRTKSPFAVIISLVQGAFPVLMCLTFAHHVVQNIGVADCPTVGIALAALKLYPIMTSFMMSDASPFAVVSSWLISLATMMWASVYLQSWDQFYMTIGYIFASVALAYNNDSQNRAVFQLIVRLQNALAENERLQEEARAEELRAMIGNVAHDLKTVSKPCSCVDPFTRCGSDIHCVAQPLTSFQCGIECMTSVVDSWNALLDEQKPSLFQNTLRDGLQTLHKCLLSMEGTNSFMAMTINRCVDYTKASKGLGLVPRLDTVLLDRKIAVPVRLIREANAGVDIVVRPRSPEICSHIITDRQWLIENILCLLSNAVKYSCGGRVELTVLLQGCMDPEVAARMHTDQCLRFEVLDAGVGLSEEAMQTLFNPFKQAQRLAGGTGLGLFSLAKRVEALHGQYGVQRRPDGAQGSLFWFTIPYRPDETSACVLNKVAADCALRSARFNWDRTSPPPFHAPAPASEALEEEVEAVKQAVPQNGLSVLVVDDAPLVVKLTVLLLSQKGYRVVNKAPNGAEALSKILAGYDEDLGTAPYDVVLMDLQMPVLDGIEAIRRLRAQEQIMEAKARIEEIGDETNAAVSKRNTVTDAPHAVAAPVDLATAPQQLPQPWAFRSRVPFHQFVIALSANSDCETKEVALKAGADGFLPKPFTYESFSEMVCE
jgi:signal transduction histidine kinase/CheY-like chemotaxis protein